MKSRLEETIERSKSDYKTRLFHVNYAEMIERTTSHKQTMGSTDREDLITRTRGSDGRKTIFCDFFVLGSSTLMVVAAVVWIVISV